MTRNRFAPFAAVFILFVTLQLALIAADGRQSPLRVAKQFAKDYYYLDPAMQKHLCADLAADSQLVDNYLYSQQVEAAQRGLPLSYLRHMFTSLHLETVSQDSASARIHLTGTTRVCINPAFMLVGKLFRIGDNYPMQVTLNLVKEENQWRVCGNPFGMKPKA